MSRVFDTPPAGVYDFLFLFYKVRRDEASRPTGTRKRPTSRESADRMMPRSSVGDDFYIGPQRVEKPPVFFFSSRLRLYCRAGVHARRIANFAKKTLFCVF